jgi:alpha-galactosidase
MPKLLVSVLLSALFVNSAFSQTNTLIRIGTHNNLLLLGVDKDHQLKQLFYGRERATGTGVPDNGREPVYTTYGTGQAVREVALRLTHSDGNLTTRLVYVDHAVSRQGDSIELTVIHLKDSYYPVEVTLFYKAYINEDVIQQWTEIKHQEKGTVTVYDFASAGLSFYSPAYYLTYYYGNWANEFNLVETPLQQGTKIIDSKLGVRVNQGSNPSFLLSLNGHLQEDNGEVIGGTLAWPGNWQLKFDVDDKKELNVLCGMNPYGSQYILPANTVFRTPAFLHTYSAEGAGAITRHFHRWARKYGIRDGYGSRDVLLNNWEATYFDFNEQKLTTIIKEAGQMGFELFLLDDGWFGNKYPRNNDDAGLGDWQVNAKKLPHGIPYLVQTCQENHLKFGIWIEPEMVNPKSELYEKHPDWVITAANRDLDLQRNQLILDLSDPQVVEYVYSSIDKLLSENKGISYIKWDCNRYVTNPGSHYLGKDRQTHLFIDYPRAVLQVMERVRKKFPDVTLMVCSGGGGRVDYASMPYFQEYWPSDNTDAADRIRIQWGLEYFFPAVGLASHVSNIPNGITGRTESLKFRFDVAMAGKLGMDLQPNQMTAADKEFSRNAIQTYKNIRDVVLHGDLYRLLSPYAGDPAIYAGDRAAQSYVSEDKDRAVVFAYQLRKSNTGNTVRLRLKGLQPDGQYLFKELNKGSYSRISGYEGQRLSGEFLMTAGISFDMYNDYESAVFELVREKEITVASGDKKTELRITIGAAVSYSVWYEKHPVVESSPISMTVDGTVLGHDAKIQKISRDSVRSFITPLYGKFKRLTNEYNEIRIDFSPSYSLLFRVYNEGLAYRWITALSSEITVNAEEAGVVLPNSYGALLSVTPKLTSWELPYTSFSSLSQVADSDNIIVPALFIHKTQPLKVVVAESDVRDYPGMFLKRDATGFHGFWAAYPKKETPYGGDWGMSTKVNEREDYIARTAGNRSFPWRVIILSDDDRELLTNQLIYKLATPSLVSDVSWIKPGKCDWEWWHDAIVKDAGFPTGMEHRSTQLYEHYIDFSATHGLEYTLIDAGWSNFYHLDTPQRVDIKELVDYGQKKNVGILVWCNATSLMGNLDHYMETFGKWGLKGIKVDFFDRDDQVVIRQQEQIAAAAAKWHLLVDLHGSPKPTGLQRTYPNVINFEAVRGEECSKWDTSSNPMYHLQIPFIRMLSGALDYTPGSMRNRSKAAFVPIPKGLPTTMGTRCHELALFILFDQYLAVLSDSPEEYRKYADIMAFLSAVPVSFDDTKVLAAKLSEYAVLAKRKGDDWYVGAMTNWEGRDMTVDLSFLSGGSYRAEILKDGADADSNAESYNSETKIVNQNTKIKLHLASGGGAVIKLSKASI